MATKERRELVDPKKLFRFKTFSERLATISIDIVHRVGTARDGPEGAATFFSEGLQKWKELNCSEDFVHFSKEVSHLSQSLPQLLHHKDTVVEVLEKYLLKRNPLALEPLLDLLIQLARDIQSDLHPHFGHLFVTVASLLHTQDTKCIEEVFTCLAYLLKFLWRPLTRDIHNTFCLYADLLGSQQRAHIRKFAAESFAYLMRKVHNLPVLFELIFKSVQNDSELTEGVGLLLFEMCKGVQKQFHSCTHVVLPLLLSMLGPVPLSDESSACSQLYHKEVFSCLQVLMQSMAEYTRKEYATLVWNLLTGAALRVAREESGIESGSSDQLKSVLHLLGIWVSWRNGSRLMANTRPLFELLVQLLQDDHYPHDLQHTLLLLCASFLLVHRATSTQDARQLVKPVFHKTLLPRLVLSFTRQLYGWPAFRHVLLPEVAPFCQLALSTSCENGEVVLLLATEVVLQTSSQWKVHPSCSDDSNWRGDRHKVDSSGMACSEVSLSSDSLGNGSDPLLVKLLKDTIRSAVSDLASGHLAMSVAHATWCSLVCSPCCRPPVVGLRQGQVELVQTLLSVTLGGGDGQGIEKTSVLLFLLGHALNSLSLVAADDKELLEAADFGSIVQLLRVHGSNVSVLGGAHNFLKACIALHKDRLADVLPVLLGNLASPCSQVRLMTLRILSLFDPLPSSDGVPCSLLATCLQVEELPANLQHVRSKVMRLQALKYSSDQMKLLPDVYHQVSLRYLLGCFYVNFSPLWPPVAELVASYAVNDYKSVFWDVYTEVLDQVARNAETSSPPTAVPQTDKPDFMDCISELFSFHLSVSHCISDDGRADHINCRVLLWKTLEKFPEFAESRSKVLVPIFLRFVEHEVTLWEESLMQHQSIHQEDIGIPNSVDANAEHGVTVDGVEGEGDEAGNEEEAQTGEGEEEGMEEDGTERELRDDGERMEKLRGSNGGTVGKEAGRARSTMRTLKQILSVFCLFKNPKVLHRQHDLHSLYTSLLLHRDPGVQGLALKCLFTYKSSNIIPYKEHLERLLNDATFTEELLSFSSVSDLYIVKPEHQAELIPVLIRLLYGRMQRFGHPKPAAQRRGAVLRFLEACRGGEVQEFIHLISAPFEQVTLSVGSRKEVVPLKKQQGFLHLVLHLLPALRDQMLPHLSKLLHISLLLTGQASELLDARHTISPPLVSLIRNIRALGIQVVKEVFVTFPDWDCTDPQFVFQCVVLPQLSRLPHEAVQSPTPLLLLLRAWTCQTQFHKYLLHSVPTSGEGDADSVMGYVYPCLFAKGVTTKVTDVVMEMTENLLQDFDVPGQQQGCVMTPQQDLPLGCQVVVPHVKELLKYFAMAMEGRLGQHAARKSLSRELSMLSRISPFVTDSSDAIQLVQLVLPFLGKTTLALHHQRSEVAVLQTCKNLVAHCDPEQFMRQFDVLFCTVSQPSSRQELCHVYRELTKNAKKHEKVADIVYQLNAWNPEHVEEPDYNARIEGFCAGKRLLSTTRIEPEVILPIINNALFYVLTSDDFSIRDSAVDYIIHVISHLSQLGMDERSSLLSAVLKTLMPAVVRGMKSKLDTAHHEFIAILGHLARSFKDHPKFKELVVLSDPDPEADFFENMRHIQVHRRARALRKVQNLIQGGSFSHTSIVSYFLPMITRVIFNTVSQKEHNLLSAAVEALGVVAARLKWSTYRYILMKNVRLLSQKSSMQKTLIRVIVAVLNSFHFDVRAAAPGLAVGPSGSEPSTAEVMDPEGGTVEEGDMKDAEELGQNAGLNGDDGEEEGSPGSADTAQKIHDSICMTVLPELRECLVKQGEIFGHHSRGAADEIEALRVPIALALVKLLQVLPERTLHTHLPGILLKICNCLKSRSKETRDVARETVIKMTQSLGPSYVPYVVKEMKDALTKGYQVHVLSYSLHALLCGLSQDLASGDLDPCLQSISDIVAEDLFGQLAEEREVPEAVSKLPEAKSSKGLATLEIVSSKLSPQLLPSLIAPLKKVVEGRPNAKLSHQVEEALCRVSLGVQGNEGFSTDHLLLFIHDLVSDSVPQLSSSDEGSEQLAGPSKATSKEGNFLIPTEPPRGGPTPVTKANAAAHLLTHFGLQLLHVSLKRERIAPSTPEHVAMLDPFVSILATTIKSKHAPVLSATLRCLQRMFKFPLPSLSLHRAAFTQELFSILGRHARRGAAGGTNQELVLTAFKTMTAVIRSSQEEDVSESQLQLLLAYIEEDMQDYQRQSTAFPLLKAILSRKLMVEEMHDVMRKVAQMVVISESDIVRTQSRHVLLQFLLDYPLGRKLYNYLGHLVSNLSYKLESGRLSVLDMCNSIFTKFPSRVLQKQAAFFFVPMCSQLLNDPSPSCREVVAVTLKTLLGRLEATKKSELLSFVFLWMKSQKLLQCQLAVQTLCLFIEVEGTGFSKMATQALPMLVGYLNPASQVEEGRRGGEEEETQIGGKVTEGGEEVEGTESSVAMETDADEEIICTDMCPLVEPSLGAGTKPPMSHDHLLFTTLTCLGKMLSTCNALIRNQAVQVSMNEVWERTEALLLHPHAWVRLASARLTGLLFAAYTPEELASGEAQRREYLLESTTEKVSDLSASFHKMLSARPLSAELGEQVVKNLVFLARVSHQLDMRGGEAEGGAASGGLLLMNMMAGMDKLARQEAGHHPKESVKRVCVFKWVGAVAVFLGADGLGCHLAPLLRPVYREYVDSREMAGKELHSLAEEVVEILKGLAGREAFARVFAAVQKEVAEVRESRKRKKALDAVVNPEVSARQKIKKNLQKREQRKRKYGKYKALSK